MLKKHKVAFISTNSESEVLKNTYKFTKQHGNPFIHIDDLENKDKLVDRGYKYQNIYILSYDEPTEGDYAFAHELGKVFKVKTVGEDHYYSEQGILYHTNVDPHHCFKIIATTDETLNLPTVSKLFLKKYCERPMEEVNVRHDNVYGALFIDNGKISIKPVKTHYTKKEVKELIMNAYQRGYEDSYYDEGHGYSKQDCLNELNK